MSFEEEHGFGKGKVIHKSKGFDAAEKKHAMAAKMLKVKHEGEPMHFGKTTKAGKANVRAFAHPAHSIGHSDANWRK